MTGGDDPKSISTAPAPTTVDATLAGQLTRLKQLLDNGTISPDEFQLLKTQLIGKQTIAEAAPVRDYPVPTEGRIRGPGQGIPELGLEIVPRR